MQINPDVSEADSRNKVGGGSRFNVTDKSSEDYYPDYGPGGNRIAYTNEAGTDSEIYTISPNGGGRLNVTDNGTGDYEPYWGSQ
jgi:Tol biopolymer transport system component